MFARVRSIVAGIACRFVPQVIIPLTGNCFLNKFDDGQPVVGRSMPLALFLEYISMLLGGESVAARFKPRAQEF